MQGLDATAVTPALATLAREFDAPAVSTYMVLTAYFVGCGACLPISGWAADRLGAKKVFIFAILLFALASLLCAFASGLGWLTAYRFLQGCAAAMITPVGRLLLLKTTPKKQLISALTTLTIPAMIGQAVGPAAGGFLTNQGDWSWVFLANLPLALFGLIAVCLFVPDVREHDRGPLDVGGAILSACAMAAAVFGISAFTPDGAGTALAVVSLVAAVTLGWLFVRRERRIASPLIGLGVFRDRVFRLTTCGAFAFRLIVGSTPFLLTVFLQAAFELDAFQTGLLIMASAAGSLLVKPFTGALISRLGYRKLLLANGVVSSLLFLAHAAMRPDWPYALIVGSLLAGGFFRSLQVTAFSTLAYADLSATQTSPASVVTSVVQQLSHAIGIAIAAGAIAMAQAGGADPVSAAVVGFVLIAIIASVALWPFSRLPASAGTNLF